MAKKGLKKKQKSKKKSLFSSNKSSKAENAKGGGGEDTSLIREWDEEKGNEVEQSKGKFLSLDTCDGGFCFSLHYSNCIHA